MHKHLGAGGFNLQQMVQQNLGASGGVGVEGVVNGLMESMSQSGAMNTMVSEVMGQLGESGELQNILGGVMNQLNSKEGGGPQGLLQGAMGGEDMQQKLGAMLSQTLGGAAAGGGAGGAGGAGAAMGGLGGGMEAMLKNAMGGAGGMEGLLKNVDMEAMMKQALGGLGGAGGGMEEMLSKATGGGLGGAAAAAGGAAADEPMEVHLHDDNATPNQM